MVGCYVMGHGLKDTTEPNQIKSFIICAAEIPAGSSIACIGSQKMKTHLKIT